MSTITKEQERAIADYLKDRSIPRGLGTRENAGSIAAINLALTGELANHIPDCMSEVVGRFVAVQDVMPDEIRNSFKWKRLLPLAAGTGRDHEPERLAILLDWMWTVVLPSIQPLADNYGFGAEWRNMTEERTLEAAHAAAKETVIWEAMNAFNMSGWGISTTAATAWVAHEAEVAITWGNDGNLSNAAAAVVRAVAYTARSVKGWEHFDPCELLKKLIFLND